MIALSIFSVESTTALCEMEVIIPQKPKTKRRPDIDVIRVGLTWGILLYHVVLIYVPYIPYYVKDPFYNFQNQSTPGLNVSQLVMLAALCNEKMNTLLY